jgi:hypothetical protein
VGELTDDFQRLLGLPDLEQFADEVLVVLERVQKTDELGARIVKLLGRAFGLRLEFLPLIGQELTLLRLEAVVLRERLELVVDVIEGLDAELRDRAITFQKSVPDLNKSIQDSAGTIDSVTDVEKARAAKSTASRTRSPRCSARSRTGTGHGIRCPGNTGGSDKREGQTALRPKSRGGSLEQSQAIAS